MIEVLDEIFKNDPAKVAQGVIFDGFPRTVAQAEALSEMLKEYGSEIHAVVGLEVEEDELIRRMLERGKQSGRSDDNLETIKKRLNVYHRQTSPLRDYYMEKGKYHSIDGNGTVDGIFGLIKRALDEAAAE